MAFFTCSLQMLRYSLRIFLESSFDSQTHLKIHIATNVPVGKTVLIVLETLPADVIALMLLHGLR